MEPQRRRFALTELRSAVERLALAGSQQVEWAVRQRVRPDELARASRDAVRTAVDNLGSEFSPVLRLRLEALVDELHSMLGEPSAMLGPDAILQHFSWGLVRHLAEAALREPGWPPKLPQGRLA